MVDARSSPNPASPANLARPNQRLSHCSRAVPHDYVRPFPTHPHCSRAVAHMPRPCVKGSDARASLVPPRVLRSVAANPTHHSDHQLPMQSSQRKTSQASQKGNTADNASTRRRTESTGDTVTPGSRPVLCSRDAECQTTPRPLPPVMRGLHQQDVMAVDPQRPKRTG